MLKKIIGIENATLRNLLSQAIWRFRHDSLFRNSMWLMLSTAIMSFFGFIFWVIAARVYSPSEIGFATALISVTVLLSSLSLLGFNTAVVRYLPKHRNPHNTISTAIIFTSLAALIISAVYLLGIHHFAPAFHDLTDNLGYAVLFMIFMVMVTLNTFTDSVFIAYRAAHYNAVVYTFFGLVKVLAPLALVAMGAYGIFFAYIGSVVVSLGLSFYFMRRAFGYKFRWTIDTHAAKQMGKFSTINYVSSLVASVPILIMPSLIVSKLGAEQAAYFYMASTIAALLYIIPQATTQSLLAEGSHDEKGLFHLVKGASKLIAIMMLPAIAALVLLGRFLLGIFGTTYAESSSILLDIMAVNGLVMAANMIMGTIMRVRHQMNEMLMMNISYFVFTMGTALAVLHKGVIWASLALLAGQVFSCVFNACIFLRSSIKRRRAQHRRSSLAVNA